MNRRMPEGVIKGLFAQAKQIAAACREHTAATLDELDEQDEGGVSLSLNRGKKDQEKEADLGRKRLQNAHAEGRQKVYDPADDLDELDELRLPEFDPMPPGSSASDEERREYQQSFAEHEREVALYEQRLKELHERLAARR